MIIEDNFFTEQEQSVINNNILTNSFPWFAQDYSTSVKFPYFSHVGLARKQDKPNSIFFDFFKDIATRFCKIHKLKIKRIHRHALNLSYCFPKYKHTDPHVDHDFKHKVLMFYLTPDSTGNTLIFNRKHKKGESTVLLLEKNPKLKVLHKIEPKQFRVACFDGLHLHAAEFPKGNKQRIISVMTFN